MRPEHEQRFRRIVSDFVERPAGDYSELLRRGHVSSPDGVDPEQWRAQIRAQARRDKIRVVTFRDELDRMQALRSDVESICLCSRCDARLYLRVGDSPASDGEAIAEPCPAPSCAPITG